MSLRIKRQHGRRCDVSQVHLCHEGAARLLGWVAVHRWKATNAAAHGGRNSGQRLTGCSQQRTETKQWGAADGCAAPKQVPFAPPGTLPGGVQFAVQGSPQAAMTGQAESEKAGGLLQNLRARNGHRRPLASLCMLRAPRSCLCTRHPPPSRASPRHRRCRSPPRLRPTLAAAGGGGNHRSMEQRLLMEQAATKALKWLKSILDLEHHSNEELARSLTDSPLKVLAPPAALCFACPRPAAGSHSLRFCRQPRCVWTAAHVATGLGVRCRRPLPRAAGLHKAPSQPPACFPCSPSGSPRPRPSSSTASPRQPCWQAARAATASWSRGAQQRLLCRHLWASLLGSGSGAAALLHASGRAACGECGAAGTACRHCCAPCLP